MEDFNTKLFRELAQGESVHELFRQALEEAINLLLESERTFFLIMRKGSERLQYRKKHKKSPSILIDLTSAFCLPRLLDESLCGGVLQVHRSV